MAALLRGCVVVLALLIPLRAAAQLACPTPPADSAAGAAVDSVPARPAPDRPAGILIRASVGARALRFTGRPGGRVEALGCVPGDTVIVPERRNPPGPVEPGVTFRDVRVGVEIRSWLDLRCL